jgi:hypothetical protein
VEVTGSPPVFRTYAAVRAVSSALLSKSSIVTGAAGRARVVKTAAGVAVLPGALVSRTFQYRDEPAGSGGGRGGGDGC